MNTSKILLEKLLKEMSIKKYAGKRKMVSFRFRPQIIEALKVITDEFNAATGAKLSKSAMIELLVMNELSTMGESLRAVGKKKKKD